MEKRRSKQNQENNKRVPKLFRKEKNTIYGFVTKSSSSLPSVMAKETSPAAHNSRNSAANTIIAALERDDRVSSPDGLVQGEGRFMQANPSKRP